MKIRSKVHRKFVSEQPCMISGLTIGVVGHHLLRAGDHSMGSKACDKWLVPLHWTIHNALHKNGNEIAFFANHGWNYEDVKELAKGLCVISPCNKIRGLYE